MRTGGLLAQLPPFEAPTLDWVGLLVVLIPAAGALVWLMLRSLIPQRLVPSVLDSAWTFALACAGFVTVVILWNRDGDTAAFGDQFVLDGMALFASAVIFVSVALVVPTLPAFSRRVGVAGPELHVLILLSAAGAVVMVGADDLIVLFLGLETMSISFYVLAALNTRRLESLEAGLKYFVLGAFSTAFLLYGIALVYGAVGTTSLAGIGQYLDTFIVLRDGMLLAGLALLLVGLAFKVAAVPFHTWAPDVYVGAPTPVTALMASAVKVAGFVVLLRVFVEALHRRADDWQPVIYALACATLVVGVVLAAVQDDAKRILAYSSVSHAGFILVGVQAATDEGTRGVLFYLAAYALIAVGAFTVLSALSGANDDRTDLASLTGLSRSRPALALGFTVLLLAQAGVPFTSGFVAKFSVIAAAVDARSFWLAVVAMICAVVAAFAYLRIVVAMYFRFSEEEGGATQDFEAVGDPLGWGTTAVVTATATVTLALGVAPGWLESLARTAAGL